MLLNLLISLLSISQNNTNSSIQDQILGDRGCGLSTEDIFFINSIDDINLIKDCKTVNGSLFINGDYNILMGGNLTPVHESAANQWILKESQWFSVDLNITSPNESCKIDLNISFSS